MIGVQKSYISDVVDNSIDTIRKSKDILYTNWFRASVFKNIVCELVSGLDDRLFMLGNFEMNVVSNDSIVLPQGAQNARNVIITPKTPVGYATLPSSVACLPNFYRTSMRIGDASVGCSIRLYTSVDEYAYGHTFMHQRIRYDVAYESFRASYLSMFCALKRLIATECIVDTDKVTFQCNVVPEKKLVEYGYRIA